MVCKRNEKQQSITVEYLKKRRKTTIPQPVVLLETGPCISVAGRDPLLVRHTGDPGGGPNCPPLERDHLVLVVNANVPCLHVIKVIKLWSNTKVKYQNFQQLLSTFLLPQMLYSNSTKRQSCSWLKLESLFGFLTSYFNACRISTTPHVDWWTQCKEDFESWKMFNSQTNSDSHPHNFDN